MALLLRKTVMLNKPPIIDAIVDDLKLRIYTQDNERVRTKIPVYAAIL